MELRKYYPRELFSFFLAASNYFGDCSRISLYLNLFRSVAAVTRPFPAAQSIEELSSFYVPSALKPELWLFVSSIRCSAALYWLYERGNAPHMALSVVSDFYQKLFIFCYRSGSSFSISLSFESTVQFDSSYSRFCARRPRFKSFSEYCCFLITEFLCFLAS